MLATRISENVKLCVFIAASVVALFLPIIEPATASRQAIGPYLPQKITNAVATLKKGVFAVVPRKSEPLFAAEVVNS